MGPLFFFSFGRFLAWVRVRVRVSVSVSGHALLLLVRPLLEHEGHMGPRAEWVLSKSATSAAASAAAEEPALCFACFDFFAASARA